MVSYLWYCISAVFMILECVVMARYIFRLPIMENKKLDHQLLGGATILICILGIFLKDSLVIPVLVLIGIYFAICNQGHRIKGFFLIFPVVGLWMGVVNLSSIILCLIPEIKSVGCQDILIDIVPMIVYVLFMIFGKGWRRRFQEENNFREYSPKERFWLNTISILLFCYAYVMRGMAQGDILADITTLIVLTSIMMCILTFTMIALLLQGNKRAYYSAMAALNEHYLEAEVAHFEAYQKTQVETRRLRHDMKNHMYSLEYLLNENDVEGAKEYLNEIGIEVKQLTTNIHTGNSVVDAIINEKQHTASNYHIAIKAEGLFPDEFSIKPVDLCTIFANALDNAIEAVKEVNDVEHRRIHIQIKTQGQYVSVIFENPMVETKTFRKNQIGKTSKEDTINHGFGLLNIQNVVKKYNGDMGVIKKQQGTIDVFVLQVRLQNPFLTNS